MECLLLWSVKPSKNVLLSGRQWWHVLLVIFALHWLMVTLNLFSFVYLNFNFFVNFIVVKFCLCFYFLCCSLLEVFIYQSNIKFSVPSMHFWDSKVKIWGDAFFLLTSQPLMAVDWFSAKGREESRGWRHQKDSLPFFGFSNLCMFRTNTMDNCEQPALGLPFSVGRSVCFDPFLDPGRNGQFREQDKRRDCSLWPLWTRLHHGLL